LANAQSRGLGIALHAARCEEGAPMGYREFIDSLGTMWKVWNTVPLAGAVLRADMKGGWLTFASIASPLRRLAPVPPEWEKLSDEQLERLCARAAEVSRPTPTGGVRQESSPNDDLLIGPDESNPNH
jgi:hypothetical protein